MSTPAGFYTREMLGRLMLSALLPPDQRPDLRDVMPEEDVPSLDLTDAETEEVERARVRQMIRGTDPADGLQ